MFTIKNVQNLLGISLSGTLLFAASAQQTSTLATPLSLEYKIAQESREYESFREWCLNLEQITQAQRHTVEVLLQQAGTSDCEQAYQQLNTMPLFALPGQQITDVSPLSGFTNLQMLLLLDNKITDVSPLATLTNLRSLDLGQNPVTDISSLSTLTNVGQISLLGSPIAQKICPVTPARRCVFDDDGQEIYDQADLAYQQGEFLVALEGLNQALDIYQASNYQVRKARVLNRLGDTQTQLGRYGEALASYQAALTLRQDLEDIEGQIISWTGMGQLYEQLGKYDQALESLQKAQGKMVEYNSLETITLDRNFLFIRLDEAALLNSLARIEIKRKDYEQALINAKEAFRLYTDIPVGVLDSDYALQQRNYGAKLALDTIGLTNLYLKKYKTALSSFQQALEVAQQIGDRAGEGLTLSHIGDTYGKAGEQTKAISFYQQALTAHQDSNDRPGEGKAYHNLGKAFQKLGQYTEAEANLVKAIEIWETLRPGLEDEYKVSLFETQANTYSALQQVLITQNRLHEGLTISERSRARSFVELLAQRLNGDISEEFQSPEPLTLEEIQGIAQQQNATLVEYSLIGSKLYIWVVQPNGVVDLEQIDLKKEKVSLSKLVKNSRQGIKQRDLAQANQNLQRLHQYLIAPIADQLPNDPESRIIFVPHKYLFLLPFPALQDETGTRLIEQHTLVTVPSLQILQLTHQQRQLVSGQNSLVIGNPTMPVATEDPEEPPHQLSSLPGAEQEAQAIASLLNTEPLTGDAATKAAVLTQLSNSRIVHFATHGLLKYGVPGESGFRDVPGAIALAPDSNDRGLLTSSEILDLELNAELVVLSACNTGRGTINSDGVIGLSRSFLTAGVPSLVVSLWAVPDDPTFVLMEEFYRQWQNSEDKAQALRQAMLNTMKEYPQPKDWAAFTLIGEAY